MPASQVFVGSSGKVAPKSQPISSDLKQANEAVYKQNLELAIRNKTLSVLRKLSTIGISSLATLEVTQRIVDTIAQELRFQAVIIALVDTDKNQLHFSAINQTPTTKEAFAQLKQHEQTHAISLSDQGNLLVRVVNNGARVVTGNFLDIVTPLVDQDVADQIENSIGVKTIILYPLTMGKKVLGVLGLGLSKKVNDLSRGERDTLDELIDAVAITVNRAQLVEDIQSTNNKLTAANVRLEELDKLKDEFVSLASHELRTPLTAIRSYIWMALSGKESQSPEKQKYYLERSFTSTNRLIKLVNSMLNISRIESGRMAIQLARESVATIIKSVIDEIAPKLTELELSVDVQVDQGVPDVIADKDKIQEVLMNFIGNAMKFTPRGGKIRITVARQESYVRVGVVDNGIGIAPENITKLFTKFGALKSGSTPEAIAMQSTGLGLYISKSIIGMHGGVVDAQSEGLGKGSTFSFTLQAYSDAGLKDLQKKNNTEGLGIIHSTIDI